MSINEDAIKVKRRETRLIPIPHWHKYHDYPSTAGLRSLRFYCETNGFNKAFLKIGRRIVVDELAFFEAIEAMNNKGGK